MGTRSSSIVSLHRILNGNRSTSSRRRPISLPIPLRNKFKIKTPKRLLHYRILYTPRLSNGLRKHRTTYIPSNNIFTIYPNWKPSRSNDTNGLLRIQKENRIPSRFYRSSNKRILINPNRTRGQHRTLNSRNTFPRHNHRTNNYIRLNLPNYVFRQNIPSPCKIPPSIRKKKTKRKKIKIKRL